MTVCNTVYYYQVRILKLNHLTRDPLIMTFKVTTALDTNIIDKLRIPWSVTVRAFSPRFPMYHVSSKIFSKGTISNTCKKRAYFSSIFTKKPLIGRHCHHSSRVCHRQTIHHYGSVSIAESIATLLRLAFVSVSCSLRFHIVKMG